MPTVDTDLNPVPFNPGGGMNPLGVVGSVVDIQNKLAQQKLLANQNQQFQATFNARQQMGKIFAAHPGDIDGAWKEGMSRPDIAPFVPDLMQASREADLALTRLQGEKLSQRDTALQMGMKLLAGGVNDVTQLPGLRDTALKLMPDKTAVDAFNSMYNSVTAGVDTKAGDPASQKKFHSNAIGLMNGVGGIPPDAFMTSSGNIPAKVVETPGKGSVYQPGTIQSNAFTAPNLAPAPTSQPPVNPLTGAASIPTSAVSVNSASPVAFDGTPLLAPDSAVKKFSPGLNSLPVQNTQQAEMTSSATKQWMDEQPAYKAASDSIGRLTDMKNDFKTMAAGGGLLTPGAGAPVGLAIAKMVNWASAALDPKAPPPFDPEKVAASEDAKKNAIHAGFGLVNQNFGGGREPLGVVNDSLAAVPGIENTPLGAMFLADSQIASATWKTQEQAYIKDWIDKGGDLATAKTSYMQQHPPEAVLEKVMNQYGLGPKGFVNAGAAVQQVKDHLMSGPMAFGQLQRQGMKPEEIYGELLKDGVISPTVFANAKANGFKPPQGQ